MATYYGLNSRKKENTSKLTGGSGKTYSSSDRTSKTSTAGSRSYTGSSSSDSKTSTSTVKRTSGSGTTSYDPNANRAAAIANKGAGTSTGSSRNTSSTVSNASAALANTGTGQIRTTPTVYDQQTALAAMMQNSQDWTGANAANQNALARENASLANAWFPGATRDDAGVWYYNGSPLYDMDFSSSVGDGTAKTNVDYATRMNPNNLTVDSFGPTHNLGGVPGGDEALAEVLPNYTDNLMTYGIIQQMKQNSAAWLTADKETQQKLAAKNRELAKQIPGAYIGNDGVWYLGGQKLYDMQYQAPVVEMPAFEMTPFEQTEMGMQLAQNYQDLLDRVQNYDAFSYDPSTDPAYLQYADSYTRGGQRAMTDVLGQLAARTGGMASSYAGSMAQQTYDQYMTDLANKIPELRQLAYSMYVDDYNRQVDDYNRAYNQYADAYGRWYDQTRFDYDRYQDELSNAWRNAEWQNTINQQNLDNYRSSLSWQAQQAQNAVENQRYEDETAYQREQDALNRQDVQAARMAQEKDDLYNRVLNQGYKVTWGDKERFGLSDEEYNNLLNAYRNYWRSDASRYYSGIAY
ncbi:MAG: hypothetical protein J6J18_03765 [Oscillospiraceae bacterium]|nr:hypothetical protein [Clostridia bacterium]MBP3672928.1 hypothetical protein [Oscillospiraceae bacterium]